MTVYKPSRAAAFAAVDAAAQIMEGRSLDDLTGGQTINSGAGDVPFVALEPVSVTADTVAETVIADGFRTWDEICVGDYEQYCPPDR